MAETPTGTTGLADPAERGSLRIADRVVERVATRAALTTHGVVGTGSALEHAVGRHYPRADAEIAGGRVRITVEVAALWPVPLTTTTDEVRSSVTREVERIVGLQVDSVDVHAAKVVLDDGARPARRVR